MEYYSKIIILLIGIIIAPGCVFFTGEIDNTPNAKLLIIGSPSPITKAILESEETDILFGIIDPQNDKNRLNFQKLSRLKIVMLDQTNQKGTSLPPEMGEDIQQFVKQGGSLIVISNPEIYLSDMALRDIMPVQCDSAPNLGNTCAKPINVTAKLYKEFDHPIIDGIDVVPEEPDAVMFLTTFNPKPIGQPIAYLQDIDTNAQYLGIIEKKSGSGTVIYFNYDAGATREIFKKTLEYLK